MNLISPAVLADHEISTMFGYKNGAIILDECNEMIDQLNVTTLTRDRSLQS